MTVKRLLKWLGVAFLIFYVAYQPQDAASVFRSVGGGIEDIASGFSEFFTSLTA